MEVHHTDVDMFFPAESWLFGAVVFLTRISRFRAHIIPVNAFASAAKIKLAPCHIRICLFILKLFDCMEFDLVLQKRIILEKENKWFDRNVAALAAELDWLAQVIEYRFSAHWGHETKYETMEEIALPNHLGGDTPFQTFVTNFAPTPPDRLVLILALAPYLQPAALDPLLQGYPDKMPVTEFGGHKGQVHRGFLPTFETALFILAGKDLALRLHYREMFDHSHVLIKDNWLTMDIISHNEPSHTAIIQPGKELLAFVTSGELGEPEFGPSFPAQKIETARSWDELVLPMETMEEINEIRSWIEYEANIMQTMKLGAKVMPGYRALFYGPPGTGKTFTASLLGRITGREVYRIDLSMVVSKYIGETEKNLKIVFDKAQSRGWILFFDEADALFGKRTDVGDSKDRYANQEVSYLLQRVEAFDGIVILATNNRDNMDKAFTRRFQSVVNFPMPNPAERLKLWGKAIPDTYQLASNVDLQNIADRYELAGGSIMNVVRFCALKAAIRKENNILLQDLLEGLRKEYKKSGRMLS